MEFISLSDPASSSSNSPTRKPLSNSSRAFLRSPYALLSTGGQNALRSQFSVSTWLCAGAALQSLLVLLPLPLPLSTYWAALPSLVVLAWKVLGALLVLVGWRENELMKGVLRGRQVALFPAADGSFKRAVGGSVGGGKVCVFLLGARSNSPLGMLSPNFISLSTYFKAMMVSLRRDSEKWGFLGSSTYENISDRTTKPEVVYVMYFASADHLHAFSRGPAHQDGWDWWARHESGLADLAISHETYEVPEARWETIYHNYAPSNFAATSHLIEEKGGVKRWASPIVKGDHKGLKGSAGRMGYVNGPDLRGVRRGDVKER